MAMISTKDNFLIFDIPLSCGVQEVLILIFVHRYTAKKRGEGTMLFYIIHPVPVMFNL